MTVQRDVIEGNKLIALFMGWEEGRFEHLPNKLHRIDAGQLCGISIDNLEYHTSWDWLMPVVEKIRQTTKHGHLITISFFSKEIGNPTECTIYLNEFGAPQIVAESLNPIEAVWQAVVEFIKWFNSQNK